MFMLVNNRPYIPYANAVEMWVLKEKKMFFFKSRVTESYSRPIKTKRRTI